MSNTKEIADAVANVLKDMQGAAQRIAQQAREFQTAYRPTVESFRAPLTSREELFKLAEPLLATQNLVKEFAKNQAPQIVALANQAFEARNRINEILRNDFARMFEGFKRLPAKTQEALLLLGEHGWYLDPQMPMPGLWSIAEALAKENVEEADAALVEYYESRLSEIEESIASKYPNRAPLIRMALAAHRSGQYGLAIPVFLAQADGVCKETFNHYFFIKKGKRPQTAAFVEEMVTDTFGAALLSPLAAALPIAASEKERGPDFTGLNRHTVMHGESLDYGTQTNSLRALSLLHYASHVLPVALNTPDDAEPDPPVVPAGSLP